MAAWGITPQPEPVRHGGDPHDMLYSPGTGLAGTVGPCEHPFFQDWPYTTKVATGQAVDYGHPMPGAVFPSLDSKLAKLHPNDALLMVAAMTPWFGEVVVAGTRGTHTVVASTGVAPGYALDADEMHQIPRHWVYRYSRVMDAADGSFLHFVTIQRIYAYDCPDWNPSLLDRALDGGGPHPRQVPECPHEAVDVGRRLGAGGLPEEGRADRPGHRCAHGGQELGHAGPPSCHLRRLNERHRTASHAR